MYTQQDLDQINAQEQKRWRLLVIPEVLLLAVLVYSLVIRVECDHSADLCHGVSVYLLLRPCH